MPCRYVHCRCFETAEQQSEDGRLDDHAWALCNLYHRHPPRSCLGSCGACRACRPGRPVRVSARCGRLCARGRHKQGTLGHVQCNGSRCAAASHRRSPSGHGPALVSVNCAGAQLAQASQMQGGFTLHVLYWCQHDQLEALRAGDDCWQSAYA